MLERFADSQLKEYAENNNSISENQFAYMSFFFCIIALIRLVDDWKWAIDNKKATIACFLDLRKAFDIINHEIFHYGCIVWMECTKHSCDKTEKLQNRAMRIILKTDRRSCSQDMRSKLGLLSLYNRRRFLRFQLSYRIVNTTVMCPKQLTYLPSR